MSMTDLVRRIERPRDRESEAADAAERNEHLAEFRLELGLPVWIYQVDGFTIEKRILMPHGQNTVHVTYRLVHGDGAIRLALRPSVHFRPHESAVNESPAKT